MRLHTLCFCFLVILLAGCASTSSQPKLVSMEDYVFETAVNTCRQKAQDLLNDYPIQRRQSYFEQCMANQGYGRETYKDRWIIFR